MRSTLQQQHTRMKTSSQTNIQRVVLECKGDVEMELASINDSGVMDTIIATPMKMIAVSVCGGRLRAF